MEQEVFLRKLTELKETARLQGNVLTKEQVEEFTAQLALNKEQETLLYDYFSENRIGIGDPLPAEEVLTGQERSYLDVYLQELKVLMPASDSEKRALTMAAMAGDRAAANRLIEIYLPDVAQIAKLYAGQGVYLEDLIGEGNTALTYGVSMLGALDEPDEADGMIGKMIMDAMEEYIAENSDQDKVNQKILSRVKKVAQRARELAGELRRKVSVSELALESGMSEKEIRDALRISAGGIEDIDENA